MARVRCNGLLCRPTMKEKRPHTAFREAARINASALIHHSGITPGISGARPRKLHERGAVARVRCMPLLCRLDGTLHLSDSRCDYFILHAVPTQTLDQMRDFWTLVKTL